MSRTTKKHPGYGRDLWGKRGAPHGSPSYCKYARKNLTRKVRRNEKKEIIDELPTHTRAGDSDE